MALRIKSALFVDFDNIFIGLNADDPRAAEEFGRSVRRWLTWMENEMAVPVGPDGLPAHRDILVRRCYGNPETFAKYRGYFTRNGFAVVDCPPLTTRGKNSADIVMVMDVLDVLTHPTHFDEFIIMSADADFTPLVLRLRMHDRRIAAIVAGNAAAAYTASCDLVVSDDEFVDRALRLPPLAPTSSAARTAPAAHAAPSGLLDAMARRVYEEASANGLVPGSRLPAIFREFREFTPRSNWLGFFTLRALTENLVSRIPELRITDEETWGIAADGARRGGEPAARDAAPAWNGSAGELRERIIDEVRRIVRAADAPVVMARAAQAVIKALGQGVLDSRWAGAGTFRQLLEQAPDLGLEIISSPQPGYIFDPERHVPPDTREPRYENLEEVAEPLASFIRRISEVTDVPRLNPHQYRLLFEVIAKEVAKAPDDLNTTSRLVRDQMLEHGETISRQHAAFVLRGIVFTGYRFRRVGMEEAPDLAYAFRGNVLNHLRSAQVVLSEDELALLDAWLLSVPASVAGSPNDAAGDGVLAPAEAAPSEPAEAASGWAPGDELERSLEPMAGVDDPAGAAPGPDQRLKSWFTEWSAPPDTPEGESADAATQDTSVPGGGPEADSGPAGQPTVVGEPGEDAADAGVVSAPEAAKADAVPDAASGEARQENAPGWPWPHYGSGN